MVEHPLWEREVVGSNPTFLTMSESEMTKNDLSYVQDLLGGTKEMRCRMCNWRIRKGERHTARTCTKWEDAHTCHWCTQLETLRRFELPDWVVQELEHTGCGNCTASYNPGEDGLCYTCEGKLVCRIHPRPSPKDVPDTDPPYHHFVEYCRLMDAWRKEVGRLCMACRELREPFVRQDYWKLAYGIWNEDWCIRCGGLRNGAYAAEYWDEDRAGGWPKNFRACLCVAPTDKQALAAMAAHPEIWDAPEEDWYV